MTTKQVFFFTTVFLMLVCDLISVYISILMKNVADGPYI